MPTASKRTKSSAKDGGGAGNASNETPVSSAENPNPAKRADGNTASTREPKKQPKPDAAPADSAPSQSEHAKALWQKLHGESDKRANGGAPTTGKTKGGFDPKGANLRNQPKGPQIRRTQGKGG